MQQADRSGEVWVAEQRFRGPARLSTVFSVIVGFVLTGISFVVVLFGMLFPDDPSIKSPTDLLSIFKIAGPLLLFGPIAFGTGTLLYWRKKYLGALAVFLSALVLLALSILVLKLR